MRDADPLDYLSNVEEPGIILRADYSDEPAWQMFCAKLQEAEEELRAVLSGAEVEGSEENADSDVDSDEQMGDASKPVDQDNASDESDDIPPLVKLISATTPALRLLFGDVSNLMSLRLLNDVDVHPCPIPPAGTKRVYPPNRLVDQSGWQEIYIGPTIWIYDRQSNNDQCVRLVSQQGGAYGTATGDSWRARVSHVCEIQFNLRYGGMKIDFGGLDKWDYNERKRNLEEAAIMSNLSL